jgi:inward rectifier potassium channel
VERSQKKGLLQPLRFDLYHWLLVLSWRKFLLVIAFFYFGLNAAFASFYILTGGGIANAVPGSFKDAFFFSIQTLSTVGYGSMYPQSLTAQWIAALEIFVGVLCIAILTGLMFARFAKPTARVIFSQVAVICPFEGVETLMFRTANRRSNRILEAQVRVSLVRDEITLEGYPIRRFYDLKLLRSQTPVFSLSWLIMHPIDAESPLQGQSQENWESQNYELWISLTGLDETFSQTIHSRYAYSPAEMRWQHRFVDVFSQSSTGQWYLDLGKFDQTVALPPRGS